MSDCNLSRSAKRARQRRRELAVLREFHVSRPLLFVMSMLSYSYWPRHRIAEVAPGYARDDVLGPITQKAAARALNEALRREIAQEVTDESLRSIHQLLARRPGIGPLDNDLPKVGTIEFTLEGARFWLEFIAQLMPWTAGSPLARPPNPGVRHWVNLEGTRWNRSIRYFRYLQSAKRYQQRAIEYNPLVRFGPIERIGRWRIRWWNEIPAGYRFMQSYPKGSPEIYYY